MRQPHPELNFRRGRGLRRITANDVAATMEWLNPWSLCVLRHQHAMGARTV